MSYPEIQPDDAQPPHSPHPQIETATEEPARLGPAGRFSAMLFSPTEAFTDINRKPTWLVPLIISILIGIGTSMTVTAILKPDYDRLTREAIKKSDIQNNRTTPPENVATAVAISKAVAKYLPILIAVVTPIFYLALAGIFALGLMLMQAKTTFRKILSVVTWSYAVTGVVGAIVVVAVLLIQDKERLSQISPDNMANIIPTNLAFFLPSDISPAMKAFAGSLDIFTIWCLILLSIGFAVISGARKISTKKTGVLVFGLWFIWILIKVGWAAAFGG